MFLAIIIALLLLLFGFVAIVLSKLPKKLPFNVKEKHVLITGGSKGIGKALAAEVLKAGCRTVTLVARDQSGLEQAQRELQNHCGPNQSVLIYAFDVTEGSENVQKFVALIGNEGGPVDLLVNNVGSVAQGAFDELPLDAFEWQMKINYLSAVYMTRAVLPQMKNRRTGHIAFVSSAAGQFAFWGYSAYSPSKFAVRALADALHMELMPYNIGVSILFPPNTETEGFQEEKRTMPSQIREIGGEAGTFKPEDVAAAFVSSIQLGEFSTSIGLEGQMLGLLSAAASPEPNPVKALIQILMAGLLRGVMLIYNNKFNTIVQKHAEKSNTKKDN